MRGLLCDLEHHRSNALALAAFRSAPATLGQTIDELRARIAAKKAELDRLRSLAPRGLSNLEYAHDLELTYTSNAIEGNALTAAETTLVIEHGITIGGKPLKDLLEAIDLYEALRYVRELAQRETPLTEGDIRNLHRLVVATGDRRPLHR